MRTTSRVLPIALFGALLTGGAAGGAAQTPLSLGSMAAARVPGGGAAELTFAAQGPGFLSVVVRSTDGEDVTLAVTDEEYQALPNGETDDDVSGDVGAEQLVVGIPGAGTYRVLVESFGGGGAAVRVGGTFMPSDLAATPPDPDGRPSTGIELTVGSTHEDAIEPAAGDARDWYRLPIQTSGVLTVFTRSDGDGDLRLEVYREGSYREPANSSDQDIDGVLGNESLTWDVTSGTTVYIRVSPALGGGERVSYRIGSGVIGG